MNLNEWISTDKATRDKLAAQWCYELRDPLQLLRIVREAAAVLANRLAHLPQVTAVTGTLANGSEIVVTTSLAEDGKLSEIPDEFATFPVVQVAVGDRKADYLQRLKFVFSAAQIPETSSETWLRFFDDHLRDVVTPYYCDIPEKWIAEAVVRAKVEDRLIGEPLVQLLGDIRMALVTFFKEFEPARLGLDPTAISRLHAILQETFHRYGFGL